MPRWNWDMRYFVNSTRNLPTSRTLWMNHSSYLFAHDFPETSPRNEAISPFYKQFNFWKVKWAICPWEDHIMAMSCVAGSEIRCWGCIASSKFCNIPQGIDWDGRAWTERNGDETASWSWCRCNWWHWGWAWKVILIFYNFVHIPTCLNFFKN